MLLILKILFQAHMNKLLRETINQKFYEVVKKEFDISDRYGRHLRWLRRLCCREWSKQWLKAQWNG